MLAPLLGLSADALHFEREAKGRPFLRHPQAPDFNLSDTHGGTLIALCRQGRVGVDLERCDRLPPAHRLARRYFTGDEASALLALPPAEASAAFLRLWTAKEASCKATGTGIFGYLGRWQFDVTALSPLPRAAPAEAGALSRWRFERLAPSDRHTAVVAVRDGGALRLCGYRLTSPAP